MVKTHLSASGLEAPNFAGAEAIDLTPSDTVVLLLPADVRLGVGDGGRAPEPEIDPVKSIFL